VSAILARMATLTLDPETRRRDLRRQGAGIRRLRDAAGLTQRQTAERLHMSEQNYRLYETGAQPLTLVNLRPWAEALGVKRSELVAALGLLNDDRPDVWWGRVELEAEGLPAEEIGEIEAEAATLAPKNQQAIVRDATREWRRRRRQQGGAFENGAAGG
jgi:transcriptional regulator with XRE-family HTH domain